MAADMAGIIKSNLQVFLCRHGETEWTLSGRHTSFSDIPLTKNGEGQAVALGQRLKDVHFKKVFVSPMIRAKQTCSLALANQHLISEPLVMEWNYGEYEGLTSQAIAKQNPTWNLFNDGAPGGESPDQITKRADRFLQSLSNETGIIAVFSHGHFLRALATRWIEEKISFGKHLYLSVASISILGFEHNDRAIRVWNETGKI